MRVREVDQFERPRPQAQPPQLPQPPRGMRADDLIRRFEPIRGHAKDPQRAPELCGHRTQGLDAAVLPAVEIPPPGTIRYEVQLAARGPLRLKDRLGWTTDHPFTARDRAVPPESARPPLGPVPPHVGMIPGQPGHP